MKIGYNCAFSFFHTRERGKGIEVIVLNKEKRNDSSGKRSISLSGYL